MSLARKQHWTYNRRRAQFSTVRCRSSSRQAHARAPVQRASFPVTSTATRCRLTIHCKSITSIGSVGSDIGLRVGIGIGLALSHSLSSSVSSSALSTASTSLSTSSSASLSSSSCAPTAALRLSHHQRQHPHQCRCWRPRRHLHHTRHALWYSRRTSVPMVDATRVPAACTRRQQQPQSQSHQMREDRRQQAAHRPLSARAAARRRRRLRPQLPGRLSAGGTGSTEHRSVGEPPMVVAVAPPQQRQQRLQQRLRLHQPQR